MIHLWICPFLFRSIPVPLFVEDHERTAIFGAWKRFGNDSATLYLGLFCSAGVAVVELLNAIVES